MYKSDFRRILSGSLLIAGTTVGAGMLGIPLVTARAGFWPGVVITCLTWLFMLCTGLLFLEATLWMPEGSNLLSMSRRFLGKKGRVFSGSLFIFLYYCLLTAYFAAGAPLLAEALNWAIEVEITGFWQPIVFALVFTGIVAAGAHWIDRVNLTLIVGMVVTYVGLIGIGAPAIDKARLLPMNWTASLFATPILFSAFGFHNIIPSLSLYFKRRRRPLVLSVVFGTIFALVVYLLWQWLILGAVDASRINEALEAGRPVTAALEDVTGNAWIYRFGQGFAFFALITSLLGVAFSVVDFLGDGLKMKRTGLARLALTGLTFFPPLLFVILDPQIFDKALGIAGGFGEALINGAIPVILVWVGRYSMKMEGRQLLPGNRSLLVVLLAASVFVMGLEVVVLLQGW